MAVSAGWRQGGGSIEAGIASRHPEENHRTTRARTGTGVDILRYPEIPFAVEFPRGRP